MKTSYQSIFTMSHKNILFGVIWSGVSCPKNLNKWMLPAFLYNLTGKYCLMSEKNSITVTVLENNFPQNILHFLVVIRMNIIRPIIIDANAAIVYHCAVHFKYSLLQLLPNIASDIVTGWKAMPISIAFSCACLHMMHTIAAVAIMDWMAAIN